MSRRRAIESGRPLRVAFYTPGLGMGGAERWVLTLAAAFSGAIEVAAIITPDVSGPLAREARRIAPVTNLWIDADVLIVWGCSRILRKYDRVICVSHGEPSLEWTRNTCAAMEAMPGVELVAVSAAAAKSWKGESTVIHNGVSVDRCMSRNGREAVRETLGIPVLGKMALFLGRLSEEKRPEILLEAVDHLPREWQVVFAGPDQMGFSEKVCGKERVKLLPPVDAPGDLLAAADVFVLPSKSEGMPLAVLEAMQADKDIVCSEWAVANELRERGVALHIMPENEEAKAWAGAIQKALWFGSHKFSARHYFSAAAMAQRWETYLLNYAY